MKTAFVHIIYFAVLVLLSFFCFYLLFGSGFVGDLNIGVLALPLAFSIFWTSGYIGRISRITLGLGWRELMNRSLSFVWVSGLLTVYGLLLSTLLINNSFFAITPVVLLIIWYQILYIYVQTGASPKRMERVLLFLLVIVSFLYCCIVWYFYIVHLF
ncbi:hypothetical protein [Salibacterium aidingense]|uniref:hypothetical protein n=1 Tax=Salibacterium aidingense TaxID=384933 RepID=UPI003BDF2125